MIRALLLAVVLAGVGSGCGSKGPEATTITVVRGDTLGKLAKTHGVTVEQLREWNGLQGDLIEVGQELTLYLGPAPDVVPSAPKKRPARKPRASKPSPGLPSSLAGLKKPARKACLAGPSEVADDKGWAGSEGLQPAEVTKGVDKMLPHMGDCITDGANVGGTLWIRLNIGCDGTVHATSVAEDPGWTPEVTACVRKVLSFAEFPAHQLPKGEEVVQPISFGVDP